MEKPDWIKKQNVSEGFKVIECKKYDGYKDFVMDDASYVLIRTYSDKYQIGVAICDYDHKILLEFRGQRAEDIWHEIFRYEKENNVEFFKSKDHVAYLGKELKKAEISLATGFEFVQE